MFKNVGSGIPEITRGTWPRSPFIRIYFENDNYWEPFGNQKLLRVMAKQKKKKGSVPGKLRQNDGQER